MSMDSPVIETINGIKVVRDDLLEGGTKRRALRPIMAASPAQEFVYAATAVGYGQLALALAARDMGRQATIFVAHRRQRHPLTQAAAAAGATIVEVTKSPAFLPQVAREAQLYVASQPRYKAQLLPLGFDSAHFRFQLTHTAMELKLRPREVWAVIGSGALISSLQDAWPKAKFHGVCVGRLPEVKNVEVHRAPEDFMQKAKGPPPFPSAPHQDAKVWQFVRERAGRGALFWNVAG